MNKLATLAITALLICGGALWFLASGSLNDFVKIQIENIGNAYTQQQVKVAKVDIELTKGAGAIQGISISNPSGYQQKMAFKLDNIGLDIDIASLAHQDPIVIQSLTIENPQAFVEFTKQGKINLKEILDNINQHLPKATDKKEPQDKINEPNIRVDSIHVAGVALTLDLRQLGNKLYQEQLPSFELNAVGGKNGLPANELGVEIARQLLNNILQQAKTTQKQKMLKKAEDTLKEKAKQKLKDLLGKFN